MLLGLTVSAIFFIATFTNDVEASPVKTNANQDVDLLMLPRIIKASKNMKIDPAIVIKLPFISFNKFESMNGFENISRRDDAWKYKAPPPGKGRVYELPLMLQDVQFHVSALVTITIPFFGEVPIGAELVLGFDKMSFDIKLAGVAPRFELMDFVVRELEGLRIINFGTLINMLAKPMLTTALITFKPMIVHQIEQKGKIMIEKQLKAAAEV